MKSYNSQYLKIVLTFFFSLFISIQLNAQDDDFGDLEGLSSEINNSTNTFSSQLQKSLGESKIEITGEHEIILSAPMTTEKKDQNINGVKAPRLFNTFKFNYQYKDIKVIMEYGINCSLDIDPDFDWTWNNLQTATSVPLKDVVGNLSVMGLENAFYWSPDKFSLGVGYQYYSWGVADKLNPTDQLNPKDYSDGIVFDKLPILSISLKYYPIENFFLEAVYIPFEQDDILPVVIEDEIPNEIFWKQQIVSFNDPNTLNPTPVFDISTEEKEVKQLEEKMTKNPEVAGIKFNYLGQNVDLSFSYLYDLDPFYTPVITLEKYQILKEDATNVISIPAVANGLYTALSPLSSYRVKEISLVRNRIHRIGFDIKSSLNKFGIWLESSYAITEDFKMESYKLRNPKLSWVTGFDFSYGPDDSFYLNFEYYGDYIQNFDKSVSKDYPNSLPDQNYVSNEEYMEKFYNRMFVNAFGLETEGLKQGISLRMEWPVDNNKIKPTLTSVYTFPLLYDNFLTTRFGSLILMPEVEFKGENTKLVFGSLLAYAWEKKKDSDHITLDKKDIIGQYVADNRVYIKFIYTWIK